MVQGAQDNATGFVAIALESTSGTPEAAPQTSPNGYIVLRGDMAPVSKKAAKFNEIVGQTFPTLPIPSPESFEMSLPMFPILDGNGLGPMLAAAMGDDTLLVLLTNHVWKHTITWETLIKTFTAFCHYGTNDDDRYRMCGIDSIDIKSKSSDNSLEIDLKSQGASRERLATGAVLTNLFIDPDASDMLTHAGLRLEFGHPRATVRDLVEELSVAIKRNLGFGALGKSGQHPAGSASHNIVNSKKSNFEMKITADDTDREEILRAMYPTNINPAYISPAITRFSDVMRYIKARMTWYGASLHTGINGEADYCNAGTLEVTFAGTYTGGDTILVGEIEIGAGTPDQFRFRYTTGGTWGEWSSWASITTGSAVTLTGCLGITATFSSTTAGEVGDKFYFCSHWRRMLRVVVPILAYKDVPKTTFKDGLRKIEIELAHTSADDTDRPYIEIVNGEGTAYDTV